MDYVIRAGLNPVGADIELPKRSSGTPKQTSHFNGLWHRSLLPAHRHNTAARDLPQRQVASLYQVAF
jgi:hypothetical protein